MTPAAPNPAREGDDVSDFANPAGDAAAYAEVYVQKLLAVLGDRNPFDVLGEQGTAVARAIAGLDAAALRRAEKPGKWSILEVIGHLVDTEIVYGYRVRMILTQDSPPLPGYDQDLWVSRLRHREGDPAEKMELLRRLRAENLRLYRSLSDAELERIGLHSERGPESIRKILRMMAAHDLVHRRQIDRIRKAVAVPDPAA